MKNKLILFSFLQLLIGGIASSSFAQINIGFVTGIHAFDLNIQANNVQLETWGDDKGFRMQNPYLGVRGEAFFSPKIYFSFTSTYTTMEYTVSEFSFNPRHKLNFQHINTTLMMNRKIREAWFVGFGGSFTVFNNARVVRLKTPGLEGTLNGNNRALNAVIEGGYQFEKVLIALSYHHGLGINDGLGENKNIFASSRGIQITLGCLLNATSAPK